MAFIKEKFHSLITSTTFPKKPTTNQLLEFTDVNAYHGYC